MSFIDGLVSFLRMLQDRAIKQKAELGKEINRLSRKYERLSDEELREKYEHLSGMERAACALVLRKRAKEYRTEG